jgi:hypothetical protein
MASHHLSPANLKQVLASINPAPTNRHGGTHPGYLISRPHPHMGDPLAARGISLDQTGGISREDLKKLYGSPTGRVSEHQKVSRVGAVDPKKTVGSKIPSLARPVLSRGETKYFQRKFPMFRWNTATWDQRRGFMLQVKNYRARQSSLFPGSKKSNYRFHSSIGTLLLHKKYKDKKHHKKLYKKLQAQGLNKKEINRILLQLKSM